MNYEKEMTIIKGWRKLLWNLQKAQSGDHQGEIYCKAVDKCLWFSFFGFESYVLISISQPLHPFPFLNPFVQTLDKYIHEWISAAAKSIIKIFKKTNFQMKSSQIYFIHPITGNKYQIIMTNNRKFYMKNYHNQFQASATHIFATRKSEKQDGWYT